MDGIRHMTQSDYGEFNQLCASLDKLHQELLPRIFQEPTQPARTIVQFRLWLDDPKIGFFGFEKSGNLIGFVYAYFQDFSKNPFYRDRKVVLLDMLVVDSNYQRQGIGKALAEHIVSWAKQNEAEDLWVTVWSANEKAVEFYSTLGFLPSFSRLSLNLESPRISV